MNLEALEADLPERTVQSWTESKTKAPLHRCFQVEIKRGPNPNSATLLSAGSRAAMCT